MKNRRNGIFWKIYYFYRILLFCECCSMWRSTENVKSRCKFFSCTSKVKTYVFLWNFSRVFTRMMKIDTIKWVGSRKTKSSLNNEHRSLQPIVRFPKWKTERRLSKILKVPTNFIGIITFYLNASHFYENIFLLRVSISKTLNLQKKGNWYQWMIQNFFGFLCFTKLKFKSIRREQKYSKSVKIRNVFMIIFFFGKFQLINAKCWGGKTWNNFRIVW